MLGAVILVFLVLSYFTGVTEDDSYLVVWLYNQPGQYKLFVGLLASMAVGIHEPASPSRIDQVCHRHSDHHPEHFFPANRNGLSRLVVLTAFEPLDRFINFCKP